MAPKKWTVKEILKVTTDYLNLKGIDSPRLSAEILLAHQLNLTRVKLYLNFDQPLRQGEVEGYRSLIRRRLNKEPVQYITGIQEFWSMDFSVGPGVLIPRPESEIIVEQVLSLYEGGEPGTGMHPKILDLGTGSGALAVSLAKELESAHIFATDITEVSLDFAKGNAARHGVESRIELLRGDLWAPILDYGAAFDVIVSNPPYIAAEEYDALPQEVRDYEPRTALDGGPDGMVYIERIIKDAPGYLDPGGWLLIEMDPDQTPGAKDLIEEITGYEKCEIVKDYSHRLRVVKVQKRRM